MAETGNILTWTLISECPIPNDVSDLLVEGEVAIDNIEKLVKMERSIKRLKKEAGIDVDEQNYHHALMKFDKVIELQEKKEQILKEYEMNLLQFIDLLKSLQLK